MAKVGGMFLKTKLDGGLLMAVMGSTSEKMYLCQVPSFGFEMIKLSVGDRYPPVHQKDKRPHKRPKGPIIRNKVIPLWAWER
jgi:hypothetical protein